MAQRHPTLVRKDGTLELQKRCQNWCLYYQPKKTFNDKKMWHDQQNEDIIYIIYIYIHIHIHMYIYIHIIPKTWAKPPTKTTIPRWLSGCPCQIPRNSEKLQARPSKSSCRSSRQRPCRICSWPRAHRVSAQFNRNHCLQIKSQKWGWVKTLYPCSSHQNSW